MSINSNKNYTSLIRNETIAPDTRTTEAAYQAKFALKTLGIFLGNILTLGILGTILDWNQSKKVKKLEVGKGDTLVQAQRRKIAELKTLEVPYSKKNDDPRMIPGKSKTDINHRYYAKGMTIDAVAEKDVSVEEFIKNSSPEALYQSAFEHVFNELVGSPKCPLSRNKAICREEYAPQRDALVNLMILDLIEEADLHSHPCGNVDLNLNNNIVVYQHRSELIYRKNKSGEIEMHEAYMVQTAFTPSNEGSVRGLIDPIGVKYILARLSADEKAALKLFLSNALIDGNSNELDAAKALIKGNQDLRYAAAMIERIANGVAERYGDTLNVFWEYYANSENGTLPEIKPAKTINAAKISYSATPTVEKTDKKAAVVFKLIAKVFLNICTLGLYSVVKCVINMRAINRLDPVSRTSRIAWQHKLYGEIRALKDIKSGKQNKVTNGNIPKEISDKLGPLLEENQSRRYQQREFNIHNPDADVDPGIIDAFIPDDEEDPLAFAQFAWRLSNKKTLENITMERLLITSFDMIFESLIDKATHGEIQFSRNENWVINAEERGNHTVITRMIVLNLIESASLTVSKNDHTLHLNGDLRVKKSTPEMIARVVNGELKNERIYLQNDPWTPPPFEDNPNPVERGTDPIGVKWILERLDPLGRLHLERLLLDELTPDDNADLITTKEYMRQNERTTQGKLIRTAVHLIKEIARAIDTRYGNLLQALWKKNANEDADQNGALSPVKAPEVQAPVNNTNTYVEWQPAVQLEPALQQYFDHTRRRVQHLHKHLDRNMLVNPKDEAVEGPEFVLASANDLYQYHMKHQMPGGKCLYGAFTSLIVQGPQVTADVERMIMRAMGDYLDKNKHEYRAKIHEDLGITAEYLVTQLRNGRLVHGSFTNVEAEIFAHTFGIKVQVFGPRCRVKNVDGLVQSATMIFGPNTKESFYLWSPGGTWYSAFPQIKEPGPGVPQEEAGSIRSIRNFWMQYQY